MMKKSILSAVAVGCLAFAGVMTATQLNQPQRAEEAAETDVVTCIPANGSAVATTPSSIVITFKDFMPTRTQKNWADRMQATFTPKSTGVARTLTFYAPLFQNPDVYSVTYQFQGSAPTEDGLITMNFPAGALMSAAGESSPAFVYTLTIGEEPAPTIEVIGSPKSGSTLSALPESATIYFEGATTITQNESFSQPVTVSWNGADKSSFLRVNVIKENYFIFDFNARSTDPDPISGEGELNITIPEGFFIIDGKYDSPEAQYSLTIRKPAASEKGIFDLWEAGYPEINSFVEEGENLSWMAMQLSEEVTLNKDCTAEIELYREGVAKPLASIPATDVENAPANVIISGDNVEFFFSKTEEFTEQGSYKVIVPAGFFLNAEGAELSESTAYFQMGAGTFDPEDGATVDISVAGGLVNSKNQWYMIKFTPFSGVWLNEAETVDGVTYEGCQTPATLTNEAGDIIAEYWASAMAYQKGILNFRINNAISENGEYVLSIPEGFFYASVNGKRAESAAMTLHYTVTGGIVAPEEDYTISPAGGTYQVFPTITITYEDVISIDVPSGATVSMDMTSKTNVLTFDVTADGNVVTLTPQEDFSEYVSDYTKYIVTVPAKLYTLDYGQNMKFPNREIVIEDIKIHPMPNMKISPADGSTMKEFTTMVVEPGIAIAGGPGMTSYIKVYKYEDGARGTQVGTFKNPVIENKDNADCTITSKFSVTGTNEVTEGEYEIEIPGTYYYITEPKRINSPKTIIHYIIGTESAVNSFKAENVNVTVYSLDGNRVLDNVAPEALRTLPNGIYVVNGKKVVIR